MNSIKKVIIKFIGNQSQHGWVIFLQPLDCFCSSLASLRWKKPHDNNFSVGNPMIWPMVSFYLIYSCRSDYFHLLALQ